VMIVNVHSISLSSFYGIVPTRCAILRRLPLRPRAGVGSRTGSGGARLAGPPGLKFLPISRAMVAANLTLE